MFNPFRKYRIVELSDGFVAQKKGYLGWAGLDTKEPTYPWHAVKCQLRYCVNKTYEEAEGVISRCRELEKLK